MLVDVVQLRYRGEKLSGDRLRAQKPIRGRLTLHDIRPGTQWWSKGKRERPLLAGLMGVETKDFIIAPLDYARVTRVRDNGMVIIGFQMAPDPNNRGRAPIYPQAWWVRPVTAASPDPVAPLP